MNFSEKYTQPIVRDSISRTISLIVFAGGGALVTYLYLRWSKASIPYAIIVVLAMAVLILSLLVRKRGRLLGAKTAEPETLHVGAAVASDSAVMGYKSGVAANSLDMSTLLQERTDLQEQLTRLQPLAYLSHNAENDVSAYVYVLNCYMQSDMSRDLAPAGTPFIEFGFTGINASCYPITLLRETEDFIKFGPRKLNAPPTVITFTNSYRAGERFFFHIRQELSTDEAKFICDEHSNSQNQTRFTFDRLRIFVQGDFTAPQVRKVVLDWKLSDSPSITLGEVIATTPRWHAQPARDSPDLLSESSKDSECSDARVFDNLSETEIKILEFLSEGGGKRKEGEIIEGIEGDEVLIRYSIRVLSENGYIG